MSSLSDDYLLEKARQFDLSAITAIYDRYTNGLYYYALRLLGDACLAEDCVSEVFSHLLKTLREGGGPRTQVKSYLFRSVHNWAVDHYRRQPMVDLDREEDVRDPGQSPQLQAEQDIVCARVREALKYLTPEQSYVVTLHFLEGWDMVEIAQEMKKPLGAVKSLQHRALTTLAKLLSAESEQAYAILQEN